MKTRLFRCGAAAVLVVVASLSVAWSAPQDRTPRVTHRWIQEFGMVTPAAGQTLRLHAVNLGFVNPPEPVVPGDALPPDPITPPDPCRVVLAFFDGEGRMIGAPIHKQLDGFTSTFLDVPFERAEGAFPPGPCRATVWVLQNSKAGEHPPDPCKASLEILDSASGRASVHMLPAVQRALSAVLR